VNCTNCKSQLPDGTRFCPICGQAAQATTPDPAASGPLRATKEMIGREIAGRIRILALLGEGGMGAVYRGEQISLRRAIAVKVLRPELSANQNLLTRFSQEAQAVAKLDHPNTVKVYDFGQDTDGSLFIAMELIDGKPLREVIGAAGPLPPARAFNIAQQVAASLADAHANNIVHRDLKPDNVMLVDKGKHKDIVRVLDFGIAKLRDDSRATQAAMTQAGDMLGTPQYMAPEQIKGEAIDGRTDIYALGCLIYEMVTARLPFEAPTVLAMLSKHLMEMPPPPSQRRPELGLSPAIDHVVMTAIQKDPAARPATMEQYAEMLAAVRAQFPGESRPMTAQVTPPVAMPVVYTPPPIATPIPPTSRVPQYQATPAPTFGGYQPPVHAKKSGNTLLIVFIAIGVLAVGAGVAVFVQQGSDTKRNTDDDYKAKIDKVETKGEPTAPPDEPTLKGSADPWSTPPSTQPQRPRPPSEESVGTRLTPIPKSAHLNPPAGFVYADAKKPGWVSYGSNQDKVIIALYPLPAGSNALNDIARSFIHDADDSHLAYRSTTKNQDHPMMAFTGDVGGIAVSVYLTVYISNRYRLGFAVAAPTGQSEAVVTKLIYGGVTWP